MSVEDENDEREIVKYIHEDNDADVIRSI